MSSNDVDVSGVSLDGGVITAVNVAEERDKLIVVTVKLSPKCAEWAKETLGYEPVLRGEDIEGEDRQRLILGFTSPTDAVLFRIQYAQAWEAAREIMER